MSFDPHPYLETKQRLNAISPSFCIAKWMHVTLHLHIGKGQSCYHCEMHDIPTASIKENPANLHNTGQKAQRRKEMLTGQKPSECGFCWQVEALDGISDRYNMSGSEWTKQGFELIDRKDHLQKINPSYVEVSFANTCNLRCSYCSASASSRWFNEIKEDGPYPVRDQAFTYLPPLVAEQENPWIEAWWKWLPDLFPGIRYLRLTGGEPLLSPNTFKLLDFIKVHKNSNLDFAVNSNMASAPAVIDKFILATHGLVSEKRVKKFTVFTSVDTWGPQAEYIRNGLDLALFHRNIRRFLAEVPDAVLSFMITFQVFSLPGFCDLLQVILDLKNEFNKGGVNRIEFSIDHLIKPTHQHLPILPRSFNTYMDRIENFLRVHSGPGLAQLDPKQLHRFQTTYRWMADQQEYEGIQIDRADFFRFFTRHDRARGVSLLTVFPEFSEFWQLCAGAHGGSGF